MKKFAQIDNGVVTGVLQAMSAPTILPPGRTFVEVEDDAQVLGASFSEGRFTPAPPPPDHGHRVLLVEFWHLFTPTQRRAIRVAAGTDADVEDFVELAKMQETILLKHPRTVAALTMLVNKNLLTQAHATRISNGIEPGA